MFLIFLIGGLSPIRVFAQKSSYTQGGFLITVEPLVGFESSERTLPTPHVKTMLIYGGRVTAGNKKLAVEGEYTQGNDSEGFISPLETIKTTNQNARLGLRTLPTLLPGWVDGIIRAGGQASRLTVETDLPSTSSKTVSPWLIHPYAGAGLQLYPVKYIALAVEVSYVFKSVTDFTQNEIQYTLGLKLRL